jgi:hypothetical protein
MITKQRNWSPVFSLLSSILNIEAICVSETLVDFQQTKGNYITEDSSLELSSFVTGLKDGNLDFLSSRKFIFSTSVCLLINSPPHWPKFTEYQ